VLVASLLSCFSSANGGSVGLTDLPGGELGVQVEIDPSGFEDSSRQWQSSPLAVGRRWFIRRSSGPPVRPRIFPDFQICTLDSEDSIAAVKDHPASIPSVSRCEPSSSVRFRPGRERKTRSHPARPGGPKDGESLAVALPASQFSPKRRGRTVL
jgi:hypothetical protein